MSHALKCMSQLRSPIVSVLGHVDHGKSSVLDAIRGSSITRTEAGGITQAIGASIIPLDLVRKICGPLLHAMKLSLTIPSLLFIDTPGHAAFTSLRKRGGSLADIAVVVVDINEGFMPQTIEAIEILRASKTPFIIAANKIDLLAGYRKHSDFFLQDIAQQEAKVQELLDSKMYQLLADLYEKFSLSCERFDRCDFTSHVAVVPLSAKQGIGIPELLMVITGLAQKYLESNLKIEVTGPAKGTILEVKEEKGLGTTLDVIVYDGTLRVNDLIVIGAEEQPVVSKVRALLLPAPLAEMRDKKAKFQQVREVSAACGVKISAPDIGKAVAGMPLLAATASNLEVVKASVSKEIADALIQTDKAGVVIKGDTIGGIEALAKLLREKGVPIRRAAVGPITGKDIADAESAFDRDRSFAAILGFNLPEVVSTDRAKVICRPIIYQLIDDYFAWVEDLQHVQQREQLDELIMPCKIEVLRNCIFRQSNPCVAGIEVLAGVLKAGTPLIKASGVVGTVKQLQVEQENVPKAEKGMQCAISLPDAVAGRQILEGDMLYADIPEEDFRKFKKLSSLLKSDEKSVLREFAEIKRKGNVVWGV
jgi:translation initiation factor 5B